MPSGAALLGVLCLLGVAAAQQQPILQQVKRTSYSETLALRMMDLAAAAYGNTDSTYNSCINHAFPPSEQRFIFSSTKQQCDLFDSTCESFIVSSNVAQETIVVFRGTKSKGQLLLEGKSSYTLGTDFYGLGRVNKYFKNGHERLWPSILAFLTKPEYRNHSLIFTGHSLGGALASLAAARTVKQGFRTARQVQLYTFGQPRTGGFNYAQSVDNLGYQSYRIVYAADIVPHQPPCAKDKSMGRTADGAEWCKQADNQEAYHHGTEIWYPQSMMPGSLYFECLGQPTNEDMNCSNQLTFQGENADAYVWDHRHYFGVKITAYGKSGCTNRTVGTEPAKKSKFASLISKFTNFFG